MMKKTVQGLMALAVLLLSTGAAQARDIFKDAQADVFVLGGGSTLVDPQDWTSADRQYHSRLQWGTKFTIGVSVPYGKLLSIESSLTYGPNNLYVTNLNVFPHVLGTGPNASVVEYPVNDYIGNLSGVVHAPFSFLHLRPYADGGVEYDRFSPTPAAMTTAINYGFGPVSTAIMTHNDKVGLSLGVGVDRKVTKRLSFRIDIRDHATGAPAFGLPPKVTIDSNATYPVAGRANNLVYTAGIVFHLGKL